MIIVNQIRLPLSCTKEDAIKRAIKIIGIGKENIDFADIAKISVDARKGTPMLVYSVAIKLIDESAQHALAGCAPCVQTVKELPAFILKPSKTEKRPIICGFGPAGMFCALALARAGYRPIVLERGPKMEDRINAVSTFEKGGNFDKNANIQFGEGGAGTFSDGKLTTRINNYLCRFVIDELINFGAPINIAIKQKPHVGTDILRDIIVNMRKEIENLGGEIKFNTQLKEVITKNGAVTAVKTNDETLECETLILAIGHSARDTFKILSESGMSLMAKPFSVGFRIEHLQEKIEQSLYHEAAGHEALPRGEYQLSQHVGKRCVYTFCMCPGGSVVPATSVENAVVTNGMSLHARDGKNANAAVVVSVNENDFNNDAFKAIEFQEKLEKSAFVAGGSNYNAPAQNVQSFLNDNDNLNITSVSPTYSRGVTPFNLTNILPEELAKSLKIGLSSFDKKIQGFTDSEVIITGLETRTSCPVRLCRNEDGQSVDIKGVFPCGEGAGYAGGIMSAAVDGLKTAEKVSLNYV